MKMIAVSMITVLGLISNASIINVKGYNRECVCLHQRIIIIFFALGIIINVQNLEDVITISTKTNYCANK